ncbi:60S ribosomal protein L19, mitochondrial-like protein [Pavlovales sp. CCMP2436]|nr:60S ribosomal protein L19, mitochondrial-like protein [Pavlovales sp. CCMP2436]|mmetsp:Transcript_16434/g.37916  ORF Transcript_16434/g.37916 Transcript_16434/m.37916 type:complete len:163 (-) Transcript_16434:298-786(-)
MASKGAAVATIRLVIPAGKATPQPPVGSALGQRGLNIMSFCKEFNDKTSEYAALVPVPVVITAYKDRSFTFIIKTPPVSYFLKKAAGITAGSSNPGTEIAGEVSLHAVYEIAKVKQTDQGLAHISLESLTKSVMGTARSMGLRVRPPAAPSALPPPTSDGAP